MSEYCKYGIFHGTNMAPESIAYTSTRPKRVNNALLFGSSSSVFLKKSLSVLFHHSTPQLFPAGDTLRVKR